MRDIHETLCALSCFSFVVGLLMVVCLFVFGHVEAEDQDLCTIPPFEFLTFSIWTRAQ